VSETSGSPAGPDRGATAASWWPWLVLPAAATALVTTGLVLGAATGFGFRGNAEALVNVPLALGFSTVAAGIWATRPDTAGLRRLGLLYSVVGLASASAIAANVWAHAAARPGIGLAGGDLAGWLGNWVWALGAPPLLALGLLLYPDGRLPGRRWWPAAVAGLAAPVLLVAGNVVGATEDSRSAAWEAVGGAGFLLLLAAAAAGLAALVVRFARADSDSDLRGQVGAFLLAGAIVVVVSALPDANTTAHAVLTVGAGVALPATVASAVVRHRLLDPHAELAARLDAVNASRRTLVSEREEERVRLRRELHDGLGPSLAAIGLGLRRLQEDVDPEQGVVVTTLADEVQRAVAEVRRICDGLRPEALNELGLVAAVTAAADRLSGLGGPTVTVYSAGVPQLTPAQEVAAYRVVMEAATNAVRHARAERIAVRMHWEDGLVAEVEDDGVGIPGGTAAGVGLDAMAERADELGGRTTVARGAGGGTLVRLWLPAGAT